MAVDLRDHRLVDVEQGDRLLLYLLELPAVVVERAVVAAVGLPPASRPAYAQRVSPRNLARPPGRSRARGAVIGLGQCSLQLREGVGWRVALVGAIGVMRAAEGDHVG